VAAPVRIFFSCSGVGITNRGIESFFREAFDGLRGTEGIEIMLYKGAGNQKSDERVLWNLPRTGSCAQWLGRAINRNGYVAEQLSTFLPMVRAIRRERPDIVFYSDSNLGFQLFRWRKQIGVPFRLLFSNGGPCHPPFDRTDYVQQVAPLYYDEAVKAGESAERHRMVPYGISVPEGSPVCETAERDAIRRRLGLPTHRPIILSVGWISAKQKRMDYLIKEVERLKEKVERPRSDFRGRKSANDPYLVMLGAMDDESAAIVSLARERLGETNFLARSVPYEEVANYYRAADLFVLASLQEGFGRVFLEALIHGLPVIAHDHPVMRFVLGTEGNFGDLSRDGAIADLIESTLKKETVPEAPQRRRESVRKRFSWPVLALQYQDMFCDCFEKVQPL